MISLDVMKRNQDSAATGANNAFSALGKMKEKTRKLSKNK